MINKWYNLRMHDVVKCGIKVWQVIEFDKKHVDMEIEQKVVKLRSMDWQWDRWFTKDQVYSMFELVQEE